MRKERLRTISRIVTNFLFLTTLFITKGCGVIDPFTGLLVSGSELEANLGMQGVVIVDARSSGYDVSHLPGAVSLKWTDYVNDAKNLKTLAELEAQLGAAGFSRDMAFVIYDDTVTSWGAAGRVFWMLEYLGCDKVHLLNGGWDKWVADGRQTETTANTLPAGVFVSEVNEKVLVDKNYIQSRINDDDFVIIDSRTDEEYNGWILYGEARGGHVPGAIQIPYAWFFKEDKTIVEYQDLKDLLESRGITPDKEVTSYCTAGIRSGFVYFILRLLGYTKCSNYDGSMYEWSADSSLPMEKLENYHLLVHPGWVQELINGGSPETYSGNGYIILESCYDCAEDTGHIPGAISVHPCYFEHGLDTSKYYPNYEAPSDGNLLPDEELQAAIEALGITKDTTLVVYGNGIIIPMTSGRVAWALMYAGVEDVRVLNGGYTAWVASGGEEEFTANSPTPVESFGAVVPVHPEYLATTSYVRDISTGKNADSVLADVRSLDEYLGIDVHHYPIFDTTGHIPGALWVDDWTEMVDMSDNTLRSYTEVRQAWEDVNVTTAKEPVFYCGTGWRSGLAFFYAYLLGYPETRNYDGGFYEWSWDPNNPIETDEP